MMFYKPKYSPLVQAEKNKDPYQMLQVPVKSARNHLLLLAIEYQCFHDLLPWLKFSINSKF